VRKLYRLTDMDARARRLTSRITAMGKKVNTPEQAFVARLAVGGMMVELVSHVPRLPVEIWGALSGLREARSAYSAFEARMAGASEHFVASVLGNPITAGPRQRRTGDADR
jgi:DNA-binding transcriptional regulator PaaX